MSVTMAISMAITVSAGRVTLVLHYPFLIMHYSSWQVNCLIFAFCPAYRSDVLGQVIVPQDCTFTREVSILMAEMHKNAAKIAIVFLHAVIQALDVRLVEKAQHMLLELPAAFTRDDLD